MNIEEVRKAADNLLKTSKFVGDVESVWGDLERDGRGLGWMYCSDEEVEHIASCCNLAPKLAKFVIEELARRDAEAAERALPITEEWLRSIGGEKHGESWHWQSVNGRYEERAWRLGFHTLLTINDRRQLLDLLAALKGGEA